MSLFDKLNLLTGTDKDALNIIIVGCGKVGITLISCLSSEGHNVSFIDTDDEIVEKISKAYDVMGIVGSGSSYKVLMEAGIENADLFIAVTESDELNLLCCTIAKKVGDSCSTIARVRNPDYIDEQAYLKEKLGLSMIINPELEAAKEISRLIRLPAALSTSPFVKSQVELIRFQIPTGNSLDGKVLFELQQEFDFKFLICAVEKEDQVIIPNGDYRLQAGDIITIISSARNVYFFFKKTGLIKKKITDAMIIGGSKTSFYLAKQLTDMGIEVKLIEINRDKCNELSETLDKVLVINGDGTEESLLLQEGIESTDAFIPLTGIDEENILLTLYAKKVTNAKVITKVNRINFNNVLRNLELGSVIHPKLLIAEQIIAYVRGKQNSKRSGNIESLYHWCDDRVEALEFKIVNHSKVTDTPISKLNLKSNLLIACISRNGKIIIPRGDDCIYCGDSIIVVTTHIGFNDIDDIIK